MLLPKASAARWLAKGLFFLIGLLLLVLLIVQIGPRVIMDNLRLIGWHFAVLSAIAMGWHFLNTFAMAVPLKQQVPFWTLFRAKLSGEAVTALTPFVYLGGEPLKAYLLKDHVPPTEAAAALVFDRFAEVAASVLYGILALIVGSHLLPIPSLMKWSFLAVLLILLIFLLVALWAITKGVLHQLYRRCTSLMGGRYFSSQAHGRIITMEKTLEQFLRADPLGITWSLLLHFGGRLLGVVELVYIMILLGHPISWPAALLITSLSMMINFAFAFIPSQIGVAEGGSTLVFHLLGIASSLGLSAGVIRRVRVLILILIGLIAYFIPSGKSAKMA